MLRNYISEANGNSAEPIIIHDSSAKIKFIHCIAMGQVDLAEKYENGNENERENENGKDRQTNQ